MCSLGIDMKQIIFTFLFCVLSASMVYADRVLLAKNPVGEYYNRVDSGAKTEAKFKASVATQFGVAESEVIIEVSTVTAAQRLAIVVDLNDDTSFRGKAVNTSISQVIPKTKREQDVETSIDSATTFEELKLILKTLIK